MGCENPILSARRRLGLSQLELGKRLGVSRETVGHWERWARAPGPEWTDGLKTVLNLSERELWQVRHRRAAETVPVRITGKRGSIW